MVVEESFSMTSGTGGQIYLGGAEATGRGELVLNDASISNLTEVSFASAECQGGGGTITLNGASELQGTDVALLFRSLQDSSLTLNDGARLRAKSLRLNAANPKDGSPLAGLEGLTAQMTLNAGSKIDSITNLQLTAANPKATTRLAMRGGEVELTSRNQPSEYNLFLGTRTAAGAVEVVGWGAIRQSPGSPQDWLRMKPYGQIIADGEGEMRDLDFGVIRTVGVKFEATNQSRETDGWYARNGGRLLYPHVQPFDHDEHTEICVGEHPWVEPSLINAFKVSLTHSGKAEMFGELYAPDRTDIPAGLAACVPKDGRIQGVWRAGLMRTSSSGGGPKTFSDATLKFRYDPTGLQPGWRLRLLHHDGTPRGRWTVVGRGPYDPDVKTISTTRPLQAVSNVDYNLGWFAVVGGERQGSVLIFR